MNVARYICANLRWWPTRNVLALGATAVAFTLYGMAFGIAEAFRAAGARHGVAVQPAVWLVATGVSAIGMTLTLFLTTTAMAHAVRARVHQLALLKALGFSHRHILALLVAEAAVPSLLGVGLGLLGAKALFGGMAMVLPALAVFPAPVLTTSIVAVALALGLLVAVLSMMIPATRIAWKDVRVLMRGQPSSMSVSHHKVPGGGANDIDLAVEPPISKQLRTGTATDLALLRQIAVVIRIGLSTLHLRLKGALLVVVGVGLSAFVLLFILSLAEGIRVGLLSGGDPSRVVLRPAASFDLDEAHTPNGLAELVAQAPGIASSSDGRALVETETFSTAYRLLRREDNTRRGGTRLVGVGPLWREMTPTFRLLSGRLPRPGTREIMAGVFAKANLSDLDDGVVEQFATPWRLVGTFATGGWWDGYLIADRAAVKEAVETLNEREVRVNMWEYQSGSAVLARLTSPSALDGFRRAVASRLPQSVVLERETDYYRQAWRRVPRHLIYMAIVLATLIGAGAAFGTAMVMDSALDDRRKDIATLRVLGFDVRAIAASVLMEGFGLAVLGSSMALAIVWLCFDGSLNNALGGVFLTTVDLSLLCVAMLSAVLIALTGTVPLAVRTMRQGVMDGVRDLF